MRVFLFQLLQQIRAGLAGVAQPGQSVRLIIERSRDQIPPPAFFINAKTFVINRNNKNQIANFRLDMVKQLK